MKSEKTKVQKRKGKSNCDQLKYPINLKKERGKNASEGEGKTPGRVL